MLFLNYFLDVTRTTSFLNISATIITVFSNAQTPPPHSGQMIFRVHMPEFAGRISKSRCALQSDESRLEYCENEQSHHVQIGVW